MYLKHKIRYQESPYTKMSLQTVLAPCVDQNCLFYMILLRSSQKPSNTAQSKIDLENLRGSSEFGSISEPEGSLILTVLDFFPGVTTVSKRVICLSGPRTVRWTFAPMATSVDATSTKPHCREIRTTIMHTSLV